MSKTGKIILITAIGLVAAGTVLIILSQDAQRKKAYSTPVPPQYAIDIINRLKSSQ
jgi:hypothetical protein